MATRKKKTADETMDNGTVESMTIKDADKENKTEDITIEEGFQKLNELLNSMESEDIGLEASFDLYKQGVELVRLLNDKLDVVEGKLNEVID